MASYDKRSNGKWRVQVRRQGLGSVSRSFLRSFLRKSDAEKWARETEALIERGEYEEKSNTKEKVSKHTPRTALCGGLDIALVGND